MKTIFLTVFSSKSHYTVEVTMTEYMINRHGVNAAKKEIK